MPAYRVELLDRQVRKQLDRIHEPDFSRVAAAILGLESDPRPPGCRKLRGIEGWRIRVEHPIDAPVSLMRTSESASRELANRVSMRSW